MVHVRKMPVLNFCISKQVQAFTLYEIYLVMSMLTFTVSIT